MFGTEFNLQPTNCEFARQSSFDWRRTSALSTLLTTVLFDKLVVLCTVNSTQAD